jgi:hypothetical protein
MNVYIKGADMYSSWTQWTLALALELRGDSAVVSLVVAAADYVVAVAVNIVGAAAVGAAVPVELQCDEFRLLIQEI